VEEDVKKIPSWRNVIGKIAAVFPLPIKRHRFPKRRK
jgi:hypothetical protein